MGEPTRLIWEDGWKWDPFFTLNRPTLCSWVFFSLPEFLFWVFLKVCVRYVTAVYIILMQGSRWRKNCHNAVIRWFVVGMEDAPQHNWGSMVLSMHSSLPSPPNQTRWRPGTGANLHRIHCFFLVAETLMKTIRDKPAIQLFLLKVV